MGVSQPSAATVRAHVMRFARSLRSPSKGFDRGQDRLPVPQRRPGKPIADLAGRHRGACAVLFNGGSLADHNLSLIRTPIIGLNRTFIGFPGYNGPDPDYYCYVDVAWKETARLLEQTSRAAVVNGSTDNADIGYRATRCMRMAPFSMDLGRDGYVSPIPCTTGHLALQLAAYLGFRDIYAVGLDMGGPHFDGTRSSNDIAWANAYHRRQQKVLSEHGVNVWLTGSPKSRCTAFPHVPYEALVERVA